MITLFDHHSMCIFVCNSSVYLLVMGIIIIIIIIIPFIKRHESRNIQSKALYISMYEINNAFYGIWYELCEYVGDINTSNQCVTLT